MAVQINLRREECASSMWRKGIAEFAAVKDAQILRKRRSVSVLDHGGMGMGQR